MIERLLIEDFALKGINDDMPDWQVPMNQITAGDNFRLVDGKLKSFGGHTDIATLASVSDVGLLASLATPDENLWIALTDAGIYRYNGSSWSATLTMPGGFSVADASRWTADLLSGTPVFNNPGWGPLYWDEPAGAVAALDLPFDATETFRNRAAGAITCQAMRSHKQFLFALNVKEGTTDYPDVVRWSHPADVGNIPVSWDESDTGYLAGRVALAGSRGKIIDGWSLRDAFAVYREYGISIFDYVGGTFVWQIRELTSTSSMINSNCISEVKGNHIFLSDGDIVLNDGNNLQSLIHHKFRRRLKSNFSEDAFTHAFVVRNDITKEVWFCVPEGSAGLEYCNVAYIWNWIDDSWAIRDLPEVFSMAYGQLDSNLRTWANWAETWTITDSLWSQSSDVLFNRQILGMRESGSDSILSSVENNVDGGTFNSYIEKTGILLTPPEQWDTIVGIHPFMEGTCPVTIEVGSQQFLGGPTTWSDPVTFTPGVDRKVDVRSTGVSHSIRVRCAETMGYWELAGLEFLYVAEGFR